jgi:lauroyl/myristoyl acyltransferase
MTAPSSDAHIQTRPSSAKTRMMGVLRVFIARIPPAIGNPLADRCGDIGYRYAAKSRRHAIRNMRQVLGPRAFKKEVKRAVHGIFHNVMRNYYDLCRAPDMRDEEIDRMVDFDEQGWQRILALHAQKRGVILVTAHFGSFDMMTQVIARRGLPLTALVSRVKPAWLSDFITNLREARGMDTLLVDEEEGGGLNLGALKRCIYILRGGNTIGVIADRNLEAQGVTIKFFGRDTVVAAGVAKMAIRTRSVVIPTFCYRLPGNRYSLTFEDSIEPPTSGSEENVKGLLTTIFGRMEYHIRRNPEQWVLLQPVWKSPRLPSESPGAASESMSGKGDSLSATTK